MAGYTRQSAASIVTSEDITAAPLNNEFNALQTAFGTGGHSHDGTAGNAPKVNLATSVTGVLPYANITNLDNLKVLGNVSGGSAAPAAVSILDEDNMASDSATSLATQQSIKAYVDGATGGAITSFQTNDGTVGSPAWSWSSDTNSGFYRIGPDNMGLALNGAKVLDIATTGLAVTGALSATGAFSLTGDTIQVTEGGTGSGTASGARINLGLIIGTDVQAQNANLSAMAGVTSATDTLFYFTGSGTGAVTTFTSTARDLLDDSSTSAMRSTLGLGSIATQNSSTVSITGGTISGITDLALADGGTGASTAANARANLGLVIGTDIQAYNFNLVDLAALTAGDGEFIVGNGTDWITESGATARASLGLGTAAIVNTGTSGGTIPLLNGNNTYSGTATFTAAGAAFSLSSGFNYILLSSGDNGAGITIQGATGFAKQFSFQTGSAQRWNVGSDDVTESGSDAGSNFFIGRRNDAGTFVDSPLTINRATGKTELTSLNVTGDATFVTQSQGDNSTKVATTAYADAAAAAISAGWVLLGTIATTSGSTASLTNIPSGYRQLLLSFEGVSKVGSTGVVQVKVSNDNGSSYSSAVAIGVAAIAASDGYNGTVILDNVSLSTAAVYGQPMTSNSTGGNTYATASFFDKTGVVDAVQVLATVSDFDGGAVKVYGLAQGS